VLYSGAASNVLPPSWEATIELPLMVTTIARTKLGSVGLGKTSVTVAPATAPPEAGQVQPMSASPFDRVRFTESARIAPSAVRRRPHLSRHHPVHVTWRMLPHVWNLRSRRCFVALARAFAGGRERRGFRLVHYSVQGNHLHLVVEAPDEVRLSRGLQGLAVRIARGLNRVMRRRGKVLTDRFHEHVLRSAAEVARAVAYVLGNFFVHALRRGEQVARPEADPYSSAKLPETGPPLVVEPGTWLLRMGWRRAAGAAAEFPARERGAREQRDLKGRAASG